MGNRYNIEKRHKVRNTAEPASTGGSSTVQHLAFTAAGAAGSALLVALLARRGYPPKKITGALAALGAGLAAIGDNDALRAFGSGAMSGSGAQLVLMLFSEYQDKKNVAAEPSLVTSCDQPFPASAVPANANVVSATAKAAAS